MKRNPLKRAAQVMLCGSTLVLSITLMNPEHARQLILAKQMEQQRIETPGEEPAPVLSPFQQGQSLLADSRADRLRGSGVLLSRIDSEPGGLSSPSMIAMASERPVGVVPESLPDPKEPEQHSSQDPGQGFQVPLVPLPGSDPHDIPGPHDTLEPVTDIEIRDRPEWEAHLKRLEEKLDAISKHQSSTNQKLDDRYAALPGRSSMTDSPGVPFDPFTNSIPDRTRPADEYGSAHRSRLAIRPIDRHGRLWKVELVHASLPDVLSALGEITGWNLVPAGTLDGDVTLSLDKVRTEDALRAVIKAAGLQLEQDGAILWVSKKSH